MTGVDGAHMASEMPLFYALEQGGYRALEELKASGQIKAIGWG